MEFPRRPEKASAERRRARQREREVSALEALQHQRADLRPVLHVRPQSVRVERGAHQVRGECSGEARNERAEQARPASVHAQHVPAAVDEQRGIRLLLGEHELDGAAHGRHGCVVEWRVGVAARKPSAHQQGVLLAQREAEHARELHHHGATRARLARLEAADVAGRDVRRDGERLLSEADPLPMGSKRLRKELVHASTLPRTRAQPMTSEVMDLVTCPLHPSSMEQGPFPSAEERNAMTFFRVLLVSICVVITVYTGGVITEHGVGFLPVFFGDLATRTWPGQFNLDFLCMLILSGLWVAHRHRFSAPGLALGVCAIFGGALFLSVYLLIVTSHVKGDVVALLLGAKRDR